MIANNKEQTSRNNKHLGYINKCTNNVTAQFIFINKNGFLVIRFESIDNKVCRTQKTYF